MVCDRNCFVPSSGHDAMIRVLNLPKVRALIHGITHDDVLCEAYVLALGHPELFNDPADWPLLERHMLESAYTTPKMRLKARRFLDLLLDASHEANWTTPQAFQLGVEAISTGVIEAILIAKYTPALLERSVDFRLQCVNQNDCSFLSCFTSENELAIFTQGEHELDIVERFGAMDGRASEAKSSCRRPDCKRWYHELSVCEYLRRFLGWSSVPAFGWLRERDYLVANIEEVMHETGNPLQLEIAQFLFVGYEQL
jgi:hypothetical protein